MTTKYTSKGNIIMRIDDGQVVGDEWILTVLRDIRARAERERHGAANGTVHGLAVDIIAICDRVLEEKAR